MQDFPFTKTNPGQEVNNLSTRTDEQSLLNCTLILIFNSCNVTVLRDRAPDFIENLKYVLNNNVNNKVHNTVQTEFIGLKIDP